MTTQIILDFDHMDDESAHSVACAVEGFINRQFTHSGFHGSIYRQEEVEPQSASAGREVLSPWSNEKITCKNCGYDKFRDKGRSLDRFNHECAECGQMTHTMTETGMSA